MVSTPRKRAAAGGARATATRPTTATGSVKPPVASSTSAASSATLAQAPQLAVRPPLEKALDSFTRELRAALDLGKTEAAALRAEMKALRAELDALRQRYEAHSHRYAQPSTGGGGGQWIELRFLQSYIDGDYPGYNKYGFWARGQSGSDGPSETATSGPSP